MSITTLCVQDSPKHELSLRETVLELMKNAHPNGLTVGDVISNFGSRGNAFLILFFSIPFIQPFPTMGLSTPLGLMIGLTGIYMSLNKPIWLPKRYLNKHVSFKIIESSCKALSMVLDKTEKFIRPRNESWFRLPIVKEVNGFLICVLGIILALPLPFIPLSNNIPAYFFIANAIAWMERDGKMMFFSHLIALAGIVYFFFVGDAMISGLILLKEKAEIWFNL